MNRINGTSAVQLLECTNPKRDIWRIRWDVHQHENGQTDYMEHQVQGKPSPDQIRSIITEYYNTQTDLQILQGLEYEGDTVWLSSENQANYKAAYDLAVQTQGESLPYKVKLGTESSPTYKEFATLQDFKAFYLSVVKHIQTCIEAGWKLKDSVDLDKYQ